MFLQAQVVPAPSNTLLPASLAPPTPAFLSHPFAGSLSSILWLKAGFLSRPCPRTTSVLTLYSLALWSHLGLCLRLLIMCWWITDRHSSPHLSLSLTLSFPLFFQSLAYIVLVASGFVRTSVRLCGMAWGPQHGLATAPASASVSGLCSLFLCVYFLWGPTPSPTA